MEITRQLRKDKLNKKGFAPIQVTICWDGHRLRVATGERVRPEHWDEEAKRVRVVPGSYSTRINPKLDKLHNTAEQAQHEAYEQQQRLSVAQLEAVLAPVLHPEQAVAPTPPAAPVDFLALMDRWIDEYRRKLHPRTYRPTSEKTIAGLKATRSRFTQFAEAKQHPLTLEGMHLAFYDAFRIYLMDELGQGLNTFGKHITRLSTFLAWCEDQELAVNRQYRKFVAPSQSAEVEALTEHELRRIRDLDFRSGEVQARLLELRGERREKGNTPGQWSYQQWAAHVELARDKFLACCYTGLRISDAERVSWHHVKGQMIHIKAEKTGGECYIPFYDDDVFKIVSLAQKYEHRTQGDLLLPTCYRVNEFLKVVQQLAGIKRLNLTTKLGRKTFATLKLYQGVPTRLVMQATGHTTEKAFNHYVGVDTIKLLQEFVRKSPGMRRSA